MRTQSAPSPGIAELMHQGPLPTVTLLIITANVLVFSAMLAHGAGLWHSSNDIQLAWGASFGPATKDGEWYRLGTAMFLHFGLAHLALNMWALWDAGRLVERLYGAARFAAIYLASGIAGNLLSLIAQGDKAISGGASGAIFGVYGALLVCLWRERRHVHPVDFRWLFGGATFFSAATISLGFFVRGIDNAAHIGGLVSGALIGTALAVPLSGIGVTRGPARWLAGGLFALCVAALVAAIPPPTYRWSEEIQARAEILRFIGKDRRINDHWQSILESSRTGGASFDQLANRVDSDVTSEYRETFEQLSALNLDPAIPSAKTLEELRKYALIRGDASRAFAEGLRASDPEQVRRALELARRAPNIARHPEPPPAPGH